MFKILPVLFSSWRFIISLVLTNILIVLLYLLVLDTSSNTAIETRFFGAGFVTFPSLIFYLHYYNAIFRNSYFRFLNLNLSEKAFFNYLFTLLLTLSAIITICCLAIYGITNSIYFGSVTVDAIFTKNLIYLVLLQVLLSSVSFIALSISTSIWLFAAIIFYFLLEDTLIVLLELKVKSLAFIGDYLPLESFSNVFISTSFDWFYFIPVLYILITSLIIYKKNYIRL